MNGLNAEEWQDAIVDQICERIFVAMGAGDVKAAFDYFDVDGNGNIGYEEFVNTLKVLDIGLSDDQARTTPFSGLDPSGLLAETRFVAFQSKILELCFTVKVLPFCPTVPT